MSGSRNDDAFALTVATDSEGKQTIPAVSTAEIATREVLAGRWEILGLVGSGGMGTVYRARDRELDEEVALKVLRNDVMTAGDAERFRREVKLARKVTHKNVARVFELAEHDGRRFFTMELVEGESLRGRLERTGRFGVDELLSVGVSVCRGLGAAHEVGVVHRDLKPDNVLVARDGRIAITDFGIASSLDAGGACGETQTFAGTPHYMAPEQVDGSGVLDARTDIYALGAMLYELAVGRTPFDAPSPVAVAAARLTRPPPDPRAARPELPEGLARIILRAMARAPADRFASAGEVEAALLAQAGRASGQSIPPVSMSALAGADASASAGSDRAVRIGVLPLAGTGLGEDEYLAGGVAEDLIDALSTMQGMRVVSYGAAASLRETTDARSAGRALGVEVVVQGSLRRLGDGRLRLTVRLIGVEDGIQLWAQRFDVSPAELLDVNETVAHAIAQAASVKAPQPDRKLADPVAIELYLRARSRYRDFWIEGALDSARCYAQALERAPDSPLLVAGHALALSRLAFFSAGEIRSARAAAERALALAPELGEAHLAAGAVALQEGNLAEAYRRGRAALARAPSLSEAHQLVGRVLAETGPVGAALTALKSAYDLDPGSSVTRRELVRAYALSGKWKEADAILAISNASPVERVAALIVQIRLSVWQDDYDAVVRARDELASIQADTTHAVPSLGVFAQALAKAIDERTVLDVNAFLPALSSEPGSTRRVIFFHQLTVEANTRFGSLETALEMFRRAVDLGLSDLVWVEACPALDPIRADARFEALAAVVRERTAEVRSLVGWTAAG